MLRVGAAQLSHETNRFSAVPTDLAAFEASGLTFGEAILPPARGTNAAFGGFLSGAEEHGLELVPILSVWATPSGLVTRDAMDSLLGWLREGLRRAQTEGALDGVLLALHGAMVTETVDDAEGAILGMVRAEVGPVTPIVATLDLHANLSAAMVHQADVLIGYDTYPHVDMAERVQEACGVLALLARGEIRPTPALRKPRMLPTSQRMTTDRNPMRALLAHAHRLEADPRAINVTVAGGFPPADVHDAGFGVLVTTDDDPDLAARLADGLAAEAWERRTEFLGGVSSFADAATALRDLPESPVGGPLLVVDIGDNPWTGGPGDSAELVRFFLAEGVSGAAVALVKDPDAVAAALSAGAGKPVRLSLGGKTDRLHGPPLDVLAEIRCSPDGRFVNNGPMMAGVPVDLGASVVLGCRRPDDREMRGPVVDVLVTSRAETPIDLNVFRAHDIEPSRRRVIGLKGKGHFRAAFEPIAREVILVEGPGITGADLSRLPFRNIRRPIWPLEPF